MRKITFTIITVCYNAEKYIEKTIDSLLSQTCKNYEYIVKDGMSTDKTLEMLHSRLDGKNNVRIVSSADTGIYDAMNQAIRMAKGEYVYFLNAGDCFYNAEVLKDIEGLISHNNPKILYGDVQFEKEGLYTKKKKYGKLYQRRLIYLLGDCICHQAMFTKRVLLEEKLFDTKFKICADRELQLYYIQKGYTFFNAGYLIAKVLVDGYSLSNVNVFEKEVRICLDRYYPKKVWIYDTFYRIKQNKAIRTILKFMQ